MERKLFCDKPAHWLLQESERAQLVVVGSRGRGGFPGMLLGAPTTAAELDITAGQVETAKNFGLYLRERFSMNIIRKLFGWE